MHEAEAEKKQVHASDQYGIGDRLMKEPSLKTVQAAREAMPDSEWFLVGGAVRDMVLGKDGATKDIDLVVRNASLDDVAARLGETGKVDMVGRRFGVLKYTPAGASQAIDIAWPRTERAGGSGAYRDFSVQSDAGLPIQDDLARRDLTVNAMAWDIREGTLIDPFGGLADLEGKVLRAVGDPEARFAEDHSRMVRAIRFACQLGFTIEKRTWEAILTLAHHIDDMVDDADGARVRVVPYEVMAKEFVKAIAADPVRAVDLFEQSGLLFRIFPELKEMAGCAQTPDHHSEGDVWTHTKLALAKLGSLGFGERFPDETSSIEARLGVLFHDIGKPDTAEQRDGRITFYGHDGRGAEIVEAIEERVRFSSVEGHTIDKERLVRLVRMHLFPNMVDLKSVRRTTLERHFLADPVFGRTLLHLAYADAAASIPEGGAPDHSNLDALLAVLEDMRTTTAERGPEKLISGEEVMAATGLTPGKEIGVLLEAIREAQLRGDVTDGDGARALLKRLHADDT